jgi:hypothetical protein
MVELKHKLKLTKGSVYIKKQGFSKNFVEPLALLEAEPPAYNFPALLQTSNGTICRIKTA